MTRHGHLIAQKLLQKVVHILEALSLQMTQSSVVQLAFPLYKTILRVYSYASNSVGMYLSTVIYLI